MSKKNSNFLINIIVVLVVLLIFLPIILMIPSMFKDKYEIFSYPWHLLPKTLNFDNFSRLLYLEYTSLAINFFRSMFVTIFIASVSVVLSLTINMIAGYAFARLRFLAKNFYG